jgi:uncharacterized membrane protein YhaH (DUF805 family)
MENFLIYLASYFAIGVILLVVLLWSYVYVMGVKRTRDRKTLTPLVYALSLPILAIGMTVDVLLNQFYFAVICFDFTHWGTVTSRMKKYKYAEASAWKKKVSAWVEKHIDDFEDAPNGHI